MFIFAFEEDQYNFFLKTEKRLQILPYEGFLWLFCQCVCNTACRAWHTPRQSLQNQCSGHLWGWAMLWPAEEVLDRQDQRVDIPAHARTAHERLLHKKKWRKKNWKRMSAESSFMSPQQPYRSRDWTDLNWSNRRTFLLWNWAPQGTAVSICSLLTKGRKGSTHDDVNTLPRIISTLFMMSHLQNARHNMVTLTAVSWWLSSVRF